MADQDPYAAIAKPLPADTDPYASIATDKVQGGPPTVSTLGSLGRGALKGIDSTISSADQFARAHLPAFMTNTAMGFGKPADLEAQKKAQQPSNTAEAIGKGVEQAGEFMIPGAGEEKLALKAGKFAPLAKVGLSALSTGTINKAQGGNFGTGAMAGAGGSLVGQGLTKLAPQIAEKAIGITKADRGFSKSPGEAIINETRGIRPSTIESSAQGRLNELNPQLESAVDAASFRPAPPIRGLLQPPTREIPLNRESIPRATRGGLFDAGVNPEELMEPRSGNPMAPISEYPGINPHYLSGNEHPELSGRFAPPSGTLLSREATGARQPVDEFGRVIHAEPEPFMARPEFNPIRSASLAPARGVVGGAIGKATAQNAEGAVNQLNPMSQFLSRRFNTGETIPENVTPRELLDLKRGFSDEFGNWNPETKTSVVGTGRKAYSALDQELDRTVPEAAGLNQRISNLIPVVRRAESTERNAPIASKLLGRFGAHTGALTLGGLGATQGYREGGTPGAILGGTAGLLAPELVATPEGQMIVARGLNKAGAIRPIVGTGLQITRKQQGQQ